MRRWFLPLARPCGPSDDYWGISVLLRWGGGGQRTPPHQTEYLARALSESQPSTPTQNHPNKQTNMCIKHSRRLTGCKETGVLILGPVLHQFSRIIAKQSDESQPGGRHRDLKDTCNTDTDWRKELNPGGFFQFQKPTKLYTFRVSNVWRLRPWSVQANWVWWEYLEKFADDANVKVLRIYSNHGYDLDDCCLRWNYWICSGQRNQEGSTAIDDLYLV